MASLSRVFLPDEVFRLVCDYLSSSDVVNVMRCSKRLSGVVGRHLYTHIELDESNHGGGGPEFPRLRLLTYKLLVRPALAEQVRSLTLRPTFGDGDQWEVPRTTTPQVVHVLQRLLGAVVYAPAYLRYSLQDKRTLLAHLRWADCADAVLAVLLPALRGLRNLDLSIPCAGYHVSHVLRAVAASHCASVAEGWPTHRFPLHQLTNVMHTWYDQLVGMGPEFTGWFLQLPNIRRIFAHRVANESLQAIPELRNQRARSSAVRHLELKDCQLPFADLRQLLRIPRTLTTLIYQIGVSHILLTTSTSTTNIISARGQRVYV